MVVERRGVTWPNEGVTFPHLFFHYTKVMLIIHIPSSYTNFIRRNSQRVKNKYNTRH